MKGWLYIKFSAVEKSKEDTSLELKWYFAEKHWELNEKQLFLCCLKSNRDELKLHDFCNFLDCPHCGWMSSCREVLMVQLIITISALRSATLRNNLSWTWKQHQATPEKHFAVQYRKDFIEMLLISASMLKSSSLKYFSLDLKWNFCFCCCQSIVQLANILWHFT